MQPKYSTFYYLIAFWFFAQFSMRANCQQKWAAMSDRLVQQNDGTVKYLIGGGFKYFATVRAKIPLDPRIAGSKSYFEVTIVKKPDGRISKSVIGVGLCTKRFQLDNWIVGDYKGSWAVDDHEGSLGIRSSDGLIGKGEGALNEFGMLKPLVASSKNGFGTGDTVGCGMYITPEGRKMVYFTKNGELVKTVRLPLKYVSQPLYPAVSMEKEGTMIKANFGEEPFKLRSILATNRSNQSRNSTQSKRTQKKGE